MSGYRKEVEQINASGMGVNSGVYSVIHPDIKTTLNHHGEFRYEFPAELEDQTYKKLLSVDMMSSNSPDEDTVADEIFSGNKGIKHDTYLGYYLDLYAGHVNEGDFRKNGSSGGMTSWVLSELLRTGEIDGVVHAHAVDPMKNKGVLFKYKVSRSVAVMKKGAKSRYYPLDLSEALKEVKEKPGKYAVVGIPEFITELRLLARQDPSIAKSLKYMIGLVCGHQKSTKYTEALAWQHGIQPGDLLEVDYRVKQPQSTAIDYLHKFTGMIDGKKVTFTKTHAELFAENWGAGFFKTQFSDFTDNTFNELADVVLGDAWVPKYNKDGNGNNIVIVRNKKIAKIIKEGMRSGSLDLDSVDTELIKDSQKGLIHHTRDELPYRLHKRIKDRLWVPKKRVRPSAKLPETRKKIQDTRQQITADSHTEFEKALENNSWSQFESNMTPLLQKYKALYAQRDLRSAPKRTKSKTTSRLGRTLQKVKDTTHVRTRIRETLRPDSDWHKRSKFENPHGAIITLTGHYNYGNIMQRYALQEFLRKNKKYFVSLMHDHDNRDKAHFDRTEQTRDFVKERIVTKQFSGVDEYPAYIVGSDQVWRNWSYKNPKKDLGYYFLNFTKNVSAKKIAYAASFGLDDIEAALGSRELAEYIDPFVKKFNAVSVREKTAVQLVRDTWDIDARVVVDPTLLLAKKDYNALIDRSPRRLHPMNAVFGYILANTTKKRLITDKVIHATQKDAWVMYLKEDKTLYPVEQWLRGFRDAEFVVTDSFHGTVFSIINNTPFVVIENKVGGVGRLVTLLEGLGLEDRLVLEDDVANFDVSKLKPIDWRTVNKRLKKLRKVSSRWLLHALEDK